MWQSAPRRWGLFTAFPQEPPSTATTLCPYRRRHHTKKNNPKEPLHDVWVWCSQVKVDMPRSKSTSYLLVVLKCTYMFAWNRHQYAKNIDRKRKQSPMYTQVCHIIQDTAVRVLTLEGIRGWDRRGSAQAARNVIYLHSWNRERRFLSMGFVGELHVVHHTRKLKIVGQLTGVMTKTINVMFPRFRSWHARMELYQGVVLCEAGMMELYTNNA